MNNKKTTILLPLAFILGIHLSSYSTFQVGAEDGPVIENVSTNLGDYPEG
jgi:hypothetical protein